jgi:hypothetical protein
MAIWSVIMPLKLLLVVVSVLVSAYARAASVPLEEPAFTAWVAERIRTGVSGAPVTVKGPLTVAVGPLQANLDRVFAYCKRAQGDCEPAIEDYVNAVVHVHKDQSARPQSEMVRLAVRRAQTIQAAQASTGAQAGTVQPRPLVDDLVTLPVLDSPRAVRMLSVSDNGHLGLSEAEVYELGKKNLRATLRPLMEVAKPVTSGQIGRVAGEDYDTSRLILVDTWKPLAAAQCGVLIVVAPMTNALFYVGEDTAQSRDALRSLARNLMSRAQNPLSDTLLKWSENGWVKVQ